MILTEIEAREISKYSKLFNFSNELSGKTILVTGAKGIVGSGIIKWLLYENEKHSMNCRIIASTRNASSIPPYIESQDNIVYVPYGDELESCSDMQIDYIVHAAAPTSNRIFKSNPVESLRVIVDGTERMLQLAQRHNSKMIYLSSEEIYGTPCEEKPVTEEFPGG